MSDESKSKPESKDDVDRIKEALFGKRMIQDTHYFAMGAFINFVVFPLLTWGVFVKAEILPFTVYGFLSVIVFVGLMRLCILDAGLAKMSYKFDDEDSGE